MYGYPLGGFIYQFQNQEEQSLAQFNIQCMLPENLFLKPFFYPFGHVADSCQNEVKRGEKEVEKDVLSLNSSTTKFE